MKKYIQLLFLFTMMSCVQDFKHQPINVSIINPDLSKKTEITFKELYHLHSNQIGKDTIITGYIVSSDLQGNFYKEIFVQNTLNEVSISDEDPRMGIKIRVGTTSASTKFAKGRKIVINLEGLKKTTSNDMITLGKPSGTYIKDILEFEIDHYIIKTDEVSLVTPKTTKLSALSTNDLNTLVKIENLHFKKSNIGKPLAGLVTDAFSGLRTLTYCNSTRKDTILLETSNYADFSDAIIPNKQVNISAIYHINYNKEPVLILNKIEDIQEVGMYVDCPQITTPNLMITEVADAKVASGEKVRYIEIYNPTSKTVWLNGWNLVRYNKTSANSYSYSVSLDDLWMAANTTLIVANNSTDFEKYFQTLPALTNTRVDGNGDDAYELIDPLGKVKDVYGIPNTDGTTTAWEYENGVAVRKTTINYPNAIFDNAEWIIKTELPQLNTQNANVDFTPGVR